MNWNIFPFLWFLLCECSVSKISLSQFEGKESSLSAEGFPSTPFIFSLPPQDVIITVNMLLVTHLQYIFPFMRKNKPLLHSSKSERRRLISEPLPLVEKVYFPFSASTSVSPLMAVTLSGLMCLLIAWIQASQGSRDPQPDIQGLSFGASIKKKKKKRNVLNLPWHFLKFSEWHWAHGKMLKTSSSSHFKAEFLFLTSQKSWEESFLTWELNFLFYSCSSWEIMEYIFGIVSHSCSKSKIALL